MLYGPKAVKSEYPPAVPVAVPIVPTKLLYEVVFDKIVVAACVIITEPMSSSIVGEEITGIAYKAGTGENKSTETELGLPAQTGVTELLANAVIPFKGTSV